EKISELEQIMQQSEREEQKRIQNLREQKIKAIQQANELMEQRSSEVALPSTSAVAQGTTTSSPLDRSPEIIVKEFYKWYIHSVSHQIDPFKTDKATLKKF